MGIFRGHTTYLVPMSNSVAKCFGRATTQESHNKYREGKWLLMICLMSTTSRVR